MTSRTVEEWIGKTPDTKIPQRVRLRVFERFGGVCQLTNRKIQPGDDWEIDGVDRVLRGVLEKRYGEVELINMTGWMEASLSEQDRPGLMFEIASSWHKGEEDIYEQLPDTENFCDRGQVGFTETIFVPPLSEIHEWVDWDYWHQANDYTKQSAQMHASVFRFPKRPSESP